MPSSRYYAAKKPDVVKNFQRDDKDSGSPEVQISLLTLRISIINDHMKLFSKDNRAKYSLVKLVERRKKLLKYLKSENIDLLKSVVQKLGIRYKI